MLRISVRVIVLVLVLFGRTVAQPPTNEISSILFTGFEHGTYPVAYRALAAYDLSRLPMHDMYRPGVESASFKSAPGRQMRVHLWYPAFSQGRPIRFDEYVWELARELEFGWEMTEEKKSRGTREFMNSLRSRLGKDSLMLEDIKPLMRASMLAARDYNNAKGKFPVVIFACLKPTTEASVMAEYLASHGFVVAAISMKGADSNLPESSVSGITAQAADIAYALSEVKKLSFTDLDKIALMGTGVGAAACMSVLTTHQEIKSYISLDGGILLQSEKQIFQQTTFYDPTRLTASMLFIYTPRTGISPLHADDYKYARRTFLKFPSMTEPFFLNYAAYERLVPGISGKDAVEVIEGSVWAAELVRAYLGASLNGKPDIELAYTLSDIPEWLAVSYDSRAALQPVPSLYDLKVMFSRPDPVPDFLKWYEEIKASNPQPYSTRLLTELFQWLGQEDADFRKRDAVVKMWTASLPTSSRGHFAAACLAKAKGDETLAKANQKKARELLDNDEDIFLDNIMRQKIKGTASLSLTAN